MIDGKPTQLILSGTLEELKFLKNEIIVQGINFSIDIWKQQVEQVSLMNIGNSIWNPDNSVVSSIASFKYNTDTVGDTEYVSEFQIIDELGYITYFL